MKETSIKILKITNIIVSILTFFHVFLMKGNIEIRMYLEKPFLYIPFILFCVSLVLYVIEFILNNGIEKVRFGIYGGEFIFLSAIYLSSDMDIFNFILVFIIGGFNSIASVLSLVRYFKGDNVEKNLPLGIMNFKHEFIITCTTLGIIEFGVVLYFVLEKNGVNPLYLLFGLPVIFIIFIFVFVKANPLIYALSLVNKKLDYESFTKELDKLMSNNLHKETRAYLETVRANYMMADDIEEALKYYEDVSVVTDKHYIHFYALVKCNFASYKHDRNEFNEGINLLHPYNKYVNWINKCNISWNVYNSKEEIKDIEKMSANPNIPFSTISNKDLLMYYYFSRGNIVKAKELANEIKDCPFRQYRKDALSVLNGDQDEEQEIINN